jgi:hypothetical protein
LSVFLAPIIKISIRFPVYWHNMSYFLTLFAQYLTLLNYSSLRMRTIRTLLLSHVRKKSCIFAIFLHKSSFVTFSTQQTTVPSPLIFRRKKSFLPFKLFFPQGKKQHTILNVFLCTSSTFFLSETRLANIHFYLRFLFLDLE